MLRKESEAVPEGNGPVPRKKNLGLANPRGGMYIEGWKKLSIDGTGSWRKFRIGWKHIPKNERVSISV